MFELTKRNAFTYAVNHLRWREVGLFSRECHRAFRAVFPMRVFANNVSLLFVFRRFAHLNILNDSNGLVKLLEHAHSTPATGQTRSPGEFRHRGSLFAYSGLRSCFTGRLCSMSRSEECRVGKGV